MNSPLRIHLCPDRHEYEQHWKPFGDRRGWIHWNRIHIDTAWLHVGIALNRGGRFATLTGSRRTYLVRRAR